MKGFLTTIVALMFMGVALPAASQARRSEEFKDKYKLKEAVVLRDRKSTRLNSSHWS